MSSNACNQNCFMHTCHPRLVLTSGKHSFTVPALCSIFCHTLAADEACFLEIDCLQSGSVSLELHSNARNCLLSCFPAIQNDRRHISTTSSLELVCMSSTSSIGFCFKQSMLVVLCTEGTPISAVCFSKQKGIAEQPGLQWRLSHLHRRHLHPLRRVAPEPPNRSGKAGAGSGQQRQ